MLCIYFSLSVQCTLTLLLQLKQTPTDSSYKQSFKTKDRPWRNNGTNLTAIQRNSGVTVAVTKSIFFPQRKPRGFPTTLQRRIFYISICFPFLKIFLYYYFLYPI